MMGTCRGWIEVIVDCANWILGQTALLTALDRLGKSNEMMLDCRTPWAGGGGHKGADCGPDGSSYVGELPHSSTGKCAFPQLLKQLLPSHAMPVIGSW